MLGSAALHVGGAPARYDGGLTHILDLETRRPRRDRVRASGSLDLLAATSSLEGPLGSRAGYIASARSLHDLGATALRGQRPYGYRDVLLGMEIEPTNGHLIRGTGFWNSEAVLLDFVNAPDDASWSNRAGSVKYKGAVGTGTLELMAAGSGYRASLPLQPTAPADQPTPDALLATAATDRIRMVGEFAWGAPGERLRLGVSHERIDAAFAARALGGGPATTTRTQTTTTGAYLDATRPLGPGLTLRAGLRGDAFSFGGFRLAPRVALMWDFDPDALITIAVGRYHQPTRTPDVEVERTLAEVVEEDLPASALLPVATADHVVVSLDQTLGTSVRLGLQGFWKRYEGLEAAPEKTIRSSGIDLQVKSAGTRAAMWLGYGLSWFWSTADLSGYGSDFAGRHLLSAGLSGGLGGPLHGEIRVAYGAGAAVHEHPLPQPRGGSGRSDHGRARRRRWRHPKKPGLSTRVRARRGVPSHRCRGTRSPASRMGRPTLERAPIPACAERARPSRRALLHVPVVAERRAHTPRRTAATSSPRSSLFVLRCHGRPPAVVIRVTAAEAPPTTGGDDASFIRSCSCGPRRAPLDPRGAARRPARSDPHGTGRFGRPVPHSAQREPRHGRESASP